MFKVGFPKYMIFGANIFLLLLAISTAGPVHAQEDEDALTLPESVSQAISELKEQNEQPEQLSAETDLTIVLEKEELEQDEGYNDAISDKWSELLAKAKGHDLRKVHELVSDLVQMRNESNYESLDEYSLVLLQLGKSRLRSNDVDGAAFYVKAALRLSPASPLVLLQGLPLMSATNVAPLGPTLWRILKSIWYYPELSLQAVKLLIYPFLWSITLALVLAFGLQFGAGAPELLSFVAGFLPRFLRGVLAPLLVPAFILFPIRFGVLWTLTAWALIAIFMMQRRTLLPLLVSTTLVLWASLLPFRENIEAWLNDEGIKSMLRITSGSFRDDDIRRVENLRERRALDPVVSYSHGQVLLRDGALKEAEEAFSHAERILNTQPWTLAERGLVAYRLGDLNEAKRLHAEAEEIGLSTPGFLFNYSKVAFGLLETALARDLFDRARKKNPELIKTLIERESLLGDRAVAEIQLPAHLVMEHSWFTDSYAEAEAKRRLDILMPAINPSHILPLGGVLAVLSFISFLRRGKVKLISPYKQVNPSKPFLFFGQVLPGETLVVFGKEAVGFLILALFSFSLFPLIEWPSEALIPFLWAPSLKPYYTGLVCFTWVILCLVGMVFSREEEAHE